MATSTAPARVESYPEYRHGMALGAAAYGMWGLFPLYWTLLGASGALETLAHRMVWSLVVMVGVLAVTGRFAGFRAVLGNRRQLGLLAIAAVLISINWGAYIWGVNNGKVVETALGYFIGPLVSVLMVELQGGGTAAGAGQIRFLRFHPFGVGADANASTNCYNPPVPPGNACSTGSPTSRVALNPTPGVWEIVVEARRTSDAAFTPYTVSASAFGATVSPNPDTVESAQVGHAVDRSYELTNAFRSFTGRATATNLGSAKVDKPTIGDQERQEFPFAVTAGATQLRAKIGNTSDAGADLDLLVYNCTSGTCNLVGASADGDSEEAVTINNPQVGNWMVAVEGFAVPAGETTYDYLDVFSGPAFGKVEVTDSDQTRPAGASWTVPGKVTAGVVPAAGRVLLGTVEVRTNGNLLVGTGNVVVKTVTQ